MKEIPFLVDVDSAGENGYTKGISLGEGWQVCKLIPVEALKKNLQSVSEAMLEALAGMKSVGDFRLEEVSLQAEITAEGGVQLIGSSKIGAKGAITLKFVVPK